MSTPLFDSDFSLDAGAPVGGSSDVEAGGGGGGSKKLIYLLLLLLLVGGGYYYFKVYKPKQEGGNEKDTSENEEDVASDTSGCSPGSIDESSKRVYVIDHHRSDVDPNTGYQYKTLIRYNVDDGNAFRYASSSGYKYARIPEFSGDVLYTINTSDFDNRTDFFKGDFVNVETGDRPVSLGKDQKHEIHAYKACI